MADFILTLKSPSREVDFIHSVGYQLGEGGLEIPLPGKKEVWGGDSIYEHGAELIASTFENREITVIFNVRGATRDDLIANVNKIERILEEARKRSIEMIGDRVELQYKWKDATNTTFFEVLDGGLQWPDNTMSVEQVLQQDSKGRYIIRNFELSLTIFPLGYPISPISGAPVEVPLTNSNGTNITGGLAVDNVNDATHGDNYVEIAAADLEGEFGVIVKGVYESDSGEAEKTSKLYIGCRKDDLTFRHILEDDDAAVVLGSPTPTADADFSSGGTYTTVSFADTAGEAELFRWDLTPAEVAATRGPFRFFGRQSEGNFWDQAANYWIEVRYSGTTLFESEKISPLSSTINFLDFGTIFLPPWLLGDNTNLAGLSIALMGEHKTTGTVTVNLDYMALIPQDGGYRVLEYRGVGMSQFEETVDDGWERTVYHQTTTGDRTGLPYGLMKRITLTPDETQRLYFFQEGTAGSTEITRNLNVQIFVVPTYMVLG